MNNCRYINPPFFPSRGNIKADTLIPKVQKRSDNKRVKECDLFEKLPLDLHNRGVLGCSSVPGGCVFIARLLAVINFSGAPDFLKGGDEAGCL